MKIIKNNTVSDLVFGDTGVTIPGSGQYTIPDNDYLLWSASDDATTHINSGDATVNDGVTDLTAARGIDYIKQASTAFGNRFLSEPERSNSLVSKNTQEAVEEVDAKITGKPRAIINYGYNGTASNRWLEINHSISSDTSPYVAAEDSKIKALSISVQNSTTATASIYVNGVVVDTITLTSATTNFKDGLAHIVSQGDTISVKITSGSTREPIVFISLEIDL